MNVSDYLSMIYQINVRLVVFLFQKHNIVV